MNRWIDGGWMGGWVSRWVGGQVDGWLDEQMDGWISWVEGCRER